MSDEIQVGDLVECVDGIAGSSIAPGSTHRVLRANHRFLYFDPQNDLSGWYRERFRKVEPPLVTSWSPKPNVHCGGPYVARSEYERVCAELEALKAHQATVDAPPLSQPDPPIWLRPGWWYWMEGSGEWWATRNRPHIEIDCFSWRADGQTTKIEDDVWLDFHGARVPRSRWQEACWQVKE